MHVSTESKTVFMRKRLSVGQTLATFNWYLILFRKEDTNQSSPIQYLINFIPYIIFEIQLDAGVGSTNFRARNS
jgi:hypothetical protein